MNRIINKTIVFILLALVAGCSSKTTHANEAPTKRPYASPLASIGTSIPIETQLPYPSVTPSLTPLPTLSFSNGDKLRSELMSTNGGCRLPCWWGIVLGKSSWDTTRQFLETFVSSIGQGESLKYYDKETLHFSTNYSIFFRTEPEEPAVTFLVIDNIVTGIVVEKPKDNNGKFHLSELLKDYGKPEHIYIQTDNDAPSSIIPFRLMIYYPSQGIAVIYEYEAKKVENLVIACGDPDTPEMHLWDPDQKQAVSEEEFLRRIFYVPHSLKEIQDVSEYSIDSFYQIYIDTAKDVCIKTPADMWP